MFFSKSRILLPLLIVMELDLVFTLLGQPSCYWDNPVECCEGCLIGKIILSRGPIFFIGFFVIYTLVSCILYKMLRKPYDNIVYMTLFLGHSWGSASWLQKLFINFLHCEINEWYLNIGYFIVVGIIFGVCSKTPFHAPEKEKVVQ